MKKKKQSGAVVLAEALKICQQYFSGKDGHYAVIRTAGKPDILLYNLYANPVQTPSLVYNTAVRDGFKMEFQATAGERILLDTPEETPDALLLAESPAFAIKKVYRKTGQPAAIVEGPLVLIRIQDSYPTPEELRAAFKKQAVTYAAVRNQTIAEEKPTTPPNQKNNEYLLLQRLRSRFQKKAV